MRQFYLLWVLLFVMTGVLVCGAQRIERIDQKSYVVNTAVTRNLDDQESHCAKLQNEIDNLMIQKQQCEKEIQDVKDQPVPKEDDGGVVVAGNGGNLNP